MIWNNDFNGQGKKEIERGGEIERERETERQRQRGQRHSDRQTDI